MPSLAKDRVAPVGTLPAVREFVNKVQALQTGNDVFELLTFFGFNDAVNDPGVISDADIHALVTDADSLAARLLPDDLHECLVSVSEVAAGYVGNLHLSLRQSDVSRLKYLCKYALKQAA